AVSALGCATYQGRTSQARLALKEGRDQEAISSFQQMLTQEKNDRLAYLLDYATALQMAGDYNASTKAFLEAAQLVEEMDYHSVTNTTASLLGSEEMIQYKGESFEKFLIHVMLAINFLMEDQLDSAMVEARRINELIGRMKMDEREPYELSSMANYLAA